MSIISAVEVMRLETEDQAREMPELQTCFAKTLDMHETAGAPPLRHAKSLNKTLSSQQLSWDSVNGLHTHMSARGATTGEERATADSPGSPGSGEQARDTEAEGALSGEGGPEEGKSLEPQPKCDICGITTTSQAHMEAHKAGRKHKRRMEAAAGRGHVKPSAHYCALCEISTTSSAHLALHLVGRAHRRRQKALDEGDSLHPVSLMGPSADGHDYSAADGADARQGSGSGGDAVSSGDARANGQGEAWKPGDTHFHRNGDYGPPPASRAHSQPDFHPPREHRHSRGNSADLGHAAVRNYLGGDPRRGAAGPSPQHPVHPGMPPPMGYGSPVQQHAAYPMGMYPYPAQFYPHGGVPQFPPGHGNPPYLPWWPAGQTSPQMSPQMSPQRMQHPGQYPMPPRMYPGAHPPLPMMGMQQMAGGFPGARPPYPPHPPPPPPSMGSYPERGPSGSLGHQPQSGYNCEVCNVQTEQLDDLKQHLRGKQHKRRLYSPANPNQQGHH